MLTRGKAGRALFGVAVAAALAFGASEARASARHHCVIDYSRGDIGYCPSQEACDADCQAIYPGSPGGACIGHCCTCAI